MSLDLLTYAGNLENLSSLSNNPHHHFVKGNIGDRELILKLLVKHQVRAVINFAAESHVDRSIHGPGDFIETNIVGTYNKINKCCIKISSKYFLLGLYKIIIEVN